MTLRVAQIFSRHFSHCLSERQSGSTASLTLIIGDAALLAPGHCSDFAPMVVNPKLGTFYYVQLVRISVGGRCWSRGANITALEFQVSANGNRGVIVNSNTSVTRLLQPMYITKRDAFQAGTTRLLDSLSSTRATT
uniref:Uncharacterized protein n=1 Tax=Nymphaea colorata TaxID=210225 RepID=A0A5K1DHB6_9MAGN